MESLESASLGLRGEVRTRCVNLEISSMGDLHFLFNICLLLAAVVLHCWA